MKFRIRNQQDFAAGVIYIVGGAGFAIGALNYRVGDAARMGPGWFPFAVGVLLVVVGFLTVLAGMKANALEEKIIPPKMGPLAWILGAVVLFGLLLPHLGMLLALFLLIVICSLASHEFKWFSTIVNAVFLVAFCIGVFIYGINLQMPLWPEFLR